MKNFKTGAIRIEQIFMLSILLLLTTFLIGKFADIPEIEKFAGYLGCVVIVVLLIVAVAGNRSQSNFVNDLEKKTERRNDLLDSLISNPDLITEYIDADGFKYEVYYAEGEFKRSAGPILKTIARADLLFALIHAKDITSRKKIV